MPSLNKVMLIGNVTRDPELKYTPNGSAVCGLGLAVNRTYTNNNNEKVEETTFVDVELWGRLAEIAGEYAKRGRPIFIEGRLKVETWEDKTTGKNRSKLKIVGENIQLLGGKESGGGEEKPRRQAAPSNRPRPAPMEADDDDIPF